MRILASLIAVWILIIGSSNAAEVYSWVDENGKRHFGDRPPENEEQQQTVEKKRVEIQNIDKGYPFTDPNLHESDGNQSYLDKQRECRKRAKEQRLAREEAKKERCWKARQRLRKLDGPVIYVDEDGNEVYVSNAERHAEHKALKKAIEEQC